MRKNIFQRGEDFWNTAQAFIHHHLPDIRRVSQNTVLSYRDGINAYIDYLETEKNIRRNPLLSTELINIGSLRQWENQEKQPCGQR